MTDSPKIVDWDAVAREIKLAKLEATRKAFYAQRRKEKAEKNK